MDEHIECSVLSLDYEEDFEADDEGPADDAEAKEAKSPSPFDETQRQTKARGAPETEDDEGEGGCTVHANHPVSELPKIASIFYLFCLATS